jgi:archaellum component FlaC
MGKLLRVLVVLFLVVSIGALVLGILLFNKRELLKGRTYKLETAVKAIGLTIESEPAEAKKAAFTAKDTSPCTAQPLESPEISDFWDTYKLQLESQDQPKLDLKSREIELMSYYKQDPVTKGPAKDAMGRLVTDGAGTMQGVLDDVLAKAGEQYDRLNQTRQQLATVRQELVTTIEDLNKRKGELRTALAKIEELNAEIEKLKGEIATLKEQIAKLQEEKQTLQDEVAEKTRQIETLQETVQEKDAAIAALKKELENRPTTRPEPQGPAAAAGGTEVSTPVAEGQVAHGEKGTVAALDEAWNFVILKLDDKFLKELLGEDLSKQLPVIDLFIKRPDESQQFVTKVRLMQVRREKKVGIADILPGWTQVPVQKGDILFY